MHLTNIAFALSAITCAFAAPQAIYATSKPTVFPGFSWSNDNFKIRGVNIGGWLVLEPWITPSIFEQFNPGATKNNIVDEYTLCQTLGRPLAGQALQTHWQTWATKQHFQLIADYGFNLVRIPIGFWAFDNTNTPYVKGAAQYLDQAIQWAREVGVMVMIDLHGAPGSQNGFDNSGHRIPSPQWQSVDQGAVRTLRVLDTIQSKYGGRAYDDVIAGIELLNEPLTPELDLNQVKTFFKNGYKQQRRYGQQRVVVVQDGFQAPNSYNGFLTPSDGNSQNVALDHHQYQVFDNGVVSLSPSAHKTLACSQAGQFDGADKWTIVGEWTGAMTDCAFALNGYGKGARYDGTFPGSSRVGSCANKQFIYQWSQQMKDDTRAYIEAQIVTYEAYSKGWVFWNFRTEAAAEWDMLRLVADGLFPKPSNGLNGFANICA